MSYWFDYMVEKERRRQEMAAAATWRQQAEYLNESARPHRRQRYQRFLAYVGEQLVVVGSRLQSRYEVVSASTGARGLTTEPASCGAGAPSDGC